MNSVFGTTFADAYDALYREKNYAAECDRVEQIFRRYESGATHRVLDLGCGTGGHALPLAQRGYAVVGVDRSAAMLEQARRKATGVPAEFHEADLRVLRLPGEFDAALMMFAVLGYQITNADARAALGAARRHLRSGGLFIADVWYGPAVLAQRPRTVVKSCPLPAGELLRTATGTLDVLQQTCTVEFRLWRMEQDRVVDRSEETHSVRYFFPQELDLLLAASGFEPVRIGMFPDFERNPDETSWNVFVIARATG